MHELAVRLRARSGVARFRWHLLRHTAGTESLRNGADSLDVQEALGHATPTMTRRYLHLTDDDRRERHVRYSPVEALLEATTGDPAPPRRRLRRGAAPG
jgi:integrase